MKRTFDEIFGDWRKWEGGNMEEEESGLTGKGTTLNARGGDGWVKKKQRKKRVRVTAFGKKQDG